MRAKGAVGKMISDIEKNLITLPTLAARETLLRCPLVCRQPFPSESILCVELEPLRAREKCCGQSFSLRLLALFQQSSPSSTSLVLRSCTREHEVQLLLAMHAVESLFLVWTRGGGQTFILGGRKSEHSV